MWQPLARLYALMVIERRGKDRIRIVLRAEKGQVEDALGSSEVCEWMRELSFQELLLLLAAYIDWYGGLTMNYSVRRTRGERGETPKNHAKQLYTA